MIVPRPPRCINMGNGDPTDDGIYPTAKIYPTTRSEGFFPFLCMVDVDLGEHYTNHAERALPEQLVHEC